MHRLAAVAAATAALLALAAPAGAETIHKGAAIHPPKRTGFVADLKAEKEWFARLETTSVAELQPGDLLLRKEYDEKSAVVQAQRVILNAPNGSRFTVHALLYLGGGRVGHASHAFGGVVVTPIDSIRPLEAVVYRPVDRAAAASAAKTMEWLTGFHLKYSISHCLASGVHSSDFGPLARHRAAQVASRKLPVNDGQMMCSEAVTFSFQGGRSAYLELDAMRTSPIRLENHLNEHHGKFRFAGVLRQK